MEDLYNRPYFFDQGIHFECQRCGLCCTGEPGTIYVDQQEIFQIARFLKISPSLVLGDYLYPFRDSYSIREDSRGRCIFFKNGCTIYSVRPSQCKTYPFWFQNLRSEENWVSLECPGIRKGPIFGKEEILSLMETSFRRYLRFSRAT